MYTYIHTKTNEKRKSSFTLLLRKVCSSTYYVTDACVKEDFRFSLVLVSSFDTEVYSLYICICIYLFIYNIDRILHAL